MSNTTLPCGPLVINGKTFFVLDIGTEGGKHFVVARPMSDSGEPDLRFEARPMSDSGEPDLRFYIEDLHEKLRDQLDGKSVLMIGMEFGSLNEVGFFTGCKSDRFRLNGLKDVLGMAAAAAADTVSGGVVAAAADTVSGGVAAAANTVSGGVAAAANTVSGGVAAAANTVSGGVEIIDTWSKEHDPVDNSTNLKAGSMAEKYGNNEHRQNWGTQRLHFTHEMSAASSKRHSLKRGYNIISRQMEENRRLYDQVFVDYNRAITQYIRPMCEAFPAWLLWFSRFIAVGGMVYFLEMEHLCSTLQTLDEAQKQALCEKFTFGSVCPLENPLYFVTAFCHLPRDVRREINSAPLTYESTTHLFCMCQKRPDPDQCPDKDQCRQELEEYIGAMRTRLQERKGWLQAAAATYKY